MKKLMAIIGATLLLAGVATSCSKTCECTATYDGVSYTETVDLSSTNYKNCSAYAKAIRDLSGGDLDGATFTCKSK